MVLMGLRTLAMRCLTPLPLCFVGVWCRGVICDWRNGCGSVAGMRVGRVNVPAFYSASVFNGDYSASVFNGDLAAWDVAQVTTMYQSKCV